MIIWRGWGILTAIIAGLTLGALFIVHDVYKFRSDWLIAAIFLAGGFANWFVGRSFNRPLEHAGIGYWKRHWLLFIQMEWWSVFFFLWGAGTLLRALVGR